MHLVLANSSLASLCNFMELVYKWLNEIMLPFTSWRNIDFSVRNVYCVINCMGLWSGNWQLSHIQSCAFVYAWCFDFVSGQKNVLCGSFLILSDWKVIKSVVFVSKLYLANDTLAYLLLLWLQGGLNWLLWLLRNATGWKLSLLWWQLSLIILCINCYYTKSGNMPVN